MCLLVQAVEATKHTIRLKHPLLMSNEAVADRFVDTLDMASAFAAYLNVCKAS